MQHAPLICKNYIDYNADERTKVLVAKTNLPQSTLEHFKGLESWRPLKYVCMHKLSDLKRKDCVKTL